MLTGFVKAYWHLFVALIVIIVLLVVDTMRRSAAGGTAVTAMQSPRLLSKPGAVLVDVSESADFKKGRAANARNVPFSKLNDQIESLAKFRKKPVIVMCRNGARAPRAASTLRKNGFEDVYTISDGFAGWEKENMPVERG